MASVLFKALQLSPKKFFDCVTHLASQPAFIAYVKSTSTYRSLVLTIALRQKVQRLRLSKVELAQRLRIPFNLLRNHLSKNLLYNEQNLRSVCEDLGIDTAFVKPVKALPMPIGLNYFDVGQVPLTRDRLETLLRKPLIALRPEMFCPYVIARQAFAAVLKDCLGIQTPGDSAAAAAKFDISVCYVRYMVNAISLPGDALLKQMYTAAGLTHKAFFARVVDTAKASPNVDEAFYSRLCYKVAFANYMEQRHASFQALAAATGFSENYLRVVRSSHFNCGVATLQRLCQSLGIQQPTYQLPYAELRMAFTYGVTYYERAVAACHRLSLTRLHAETTRRNYIAFRLAIARGLTAAVETSALQKTDIASTCRLQPNRFSALLSGSLLPTVAELTRLLRLLEKTPGAFWGDVHVWIRQPAFIASVPKAWHAALSLKQRIASIVETLDMSLQDIATAAGISKPSLARACSAYIPLLSTASLERILKALTTLEASCYPQKKT